MDFSSSSTPRAKKPTSRHLRDRLGTGTSIEPLADRALLALQGPAAAAVLSRFLEGIAGLRFMSAAEVTIGGAQCLVTRSGYTGEDGFEISLPAGEAEGFARLLIAEPEVLPIGLGARDSLRLEAGLCLYGHDIDETTTPIEADLAWTIGKRRRAEGGFPGAATILRQLAEGTPRKRVGIRPDGRAPAREDTEIVDEAGNRLGKVTSGGFGPSVGGRSQWAMSTLPMRWRARPCSFWCVAPRGRRAIVRLPFFRPAITAADPRKRMKMRWTSAVPPSRRRLRRLLRMRAFPNAIKDFPHAEERPWARLEARTTSMQLNSSPIRRGQIRMSLLRFTKDHEWVRLDGDLAVVGITDYAQSQLGDVVYVELPEIGRRVEKGKEAAVVELVKAASEVYAPVSGEVAEVNDALAADPAKVNADPMGEGWFLKLRLADPKELDGLLDEDAYQRFVEEQH